ncbi:MAG: ankyrin repeat domain-containing protein, partial [Proteobacteria bacterium]|nr:ankyrin repeat domain-containing protein [Pseudomonadota bacterium]
MNQQEYTEWKKEIKNTCAREIHPEGPIKYRYFRFVPVELKDEQPNMCVQLSLLQIKYQGTVLTGAKASNPGGANGPNEGPQNAVDGRLTTKWLDWEIHPLVLDFESPTLMDTYTWATANDFSYRDPISWRFEGSSDGDIWYLIDAKDNYPVPESRHQFLPDINPTVSGERLKLKSNSEIFKQDHESLLVKIYNELVDYCRSGNLDGLREKLTRENVHINSSLSSGQNYPLLHHAVIHRLEQEEIFDELLSKGAELDEVNSDGQTALTLAAINGQLEHIKYFVNKGANLKHRDKEGYTVWLLAANRGHLYLLEYLYTIDPLFLRERNNAGESAMDIAKNLNYQKMQQWIEAKLNDEDRKYSQINCSFPIDYNNWVVSIMRKPKGKSPEHAFIVLEGLDERTGKHTMWRFDLIKDPNKPEYSMIVPPEPKPIVASESEVVHETQLLLKLTKGDKALFLSWSIGTAKKEQLLKDIKKDTLDPPMYLESGSESLSAQSNLSEEHNYHSCFTWSREKLRNLNIKNINDDLGSQLTDWIVAPSSLYIPDPNNQYELLKRLAKIFQRKIINIINIRSIAISIVAIFSYYINIRSVIADYFNHIDVNELLLIGINEDDLKKVEIALEQGADIELRDNLNITILSLVLRKKLNNSEKIASLLLETDKITAKILREQDGSENGLNRTPLHWAVHYGYDNLVKRFLEILVKDKAVLTTLEIRDDYGNTALHVAVEQKEFKAFKMLYDAGSNVKVKSNRATVLYMIIEDNFIKDIFAQSNPQFLKRLFEIKDDDGNMLLHYAIDFDGKAYIFETLNSIELLPKLVLQKNSLGKTVFDLAQQSGKKEIVEIIKNSLNIVGYLPQEKKDIKNEFSEISLENVLHMNKDELNNSLTELEIVVSPRTPEQMIEENINSFSTTPSDIDQSLENRESIDEATRILCISYVSGLKSKNEKARIHAINKIKELGCIKLPEIIDALRDILRSGDCWQREFAAKVFIEENLIDSKEIFEEIRHALEENLKNESFSWGTDCPL